MGLISYFLWSFLLLVAYLAYKLIIKPKALVQFYRNQGAVLTFSPGGGIFVQNRRNVELHGDYGYQFKEYAKCDPKPRVVGGNVGSSVLLAFIDPELMKEFFTNHEMYEKPDSILGLYRFCINDGLVFSEGKQWKRHRKYTSMAFRFDLVKNMVPEIVNIAREFFTDLKCKNLSGVSLLEEFQQITGETIGRVFFGEKFKDQSLRGSSITTFMGKLTGRISYNSLHPFNLLFGKKLVLKGFLKPHREMIDDIVYVRAWAKKIVEKKLKEIEKAAGNNQKTEDKSLFDIFIKQRKDFPEEAFKDEEIIDEFMTFFIAGLDTTSHLTSRVMYYLHDNPVCKEKVLKEVQDNFQNLDDITLDNVNKLDYTNACIKETLRLSTPAPFIFTREAIKDHRVGDFNVKKGTMCTSWFICNNFDPRYHEDPEVFNPKRWIDPNSLTNKSITNPYVYSPFSIGGRNCIGQHLAMIESKIIIATFMKMFEFERADPNYKLEMKFEFMYQPKVDPLYKLKLKA